MKKFIFSFSEKNTLRCGYTARYSPQEGKKKRSQAIVPDCV